MDEFVIAFINRVKRTTSLKSGLSMHNYVDAQCFLSKFGHTTSDE